MSAQDPLGYSSPGSWEISSVTPSGFVSVYDSRTGPPSLEVEGGGKTVVVHTPKGRGAGDR